MAVCAPGIVGGNGDALVRQPQSSTGTAVHRALLSLQLMMAFGLVLLIIALLAAVAPALVGYESFMVLSGSMEPTIKVGADAGKGGRSTHLALALARGLAGLPPEQRRRIAFLAAGTDDRDGDTPVSGGLVDGTHPNDLGFQWMAEGLGARLRKLLGLR